MYNSQVSLDDVSLINEENTSIHKAFGNETNKPRRQDNDEVKGIGGRKLEL